MPQYATTERKGESRPERRGTSFRPRYVLLVVYFFPTNINTYYSLYIYYNSHTMMTWHYDDVMACHNGGEGLPWRPGIFYLFFVLRLVLHVLIHPLRYKLL